MAEWDGKSNLITSSAFHLNGKDVDVKKVGRELGVGAVLTDHQLDEKAGC